jgi:hypothetical protein
MVKAVRRPNVDRTVPGGDKSTKLGRPKLWGRATDFGAPRSLRHGTL